MAIRGYYLGCPAWGFKEWVGNLYPRGCRAGEYLSRYAEVFNAVEGNTTFYSLPAVETVQRWREATPQSFRFCFKFPRTITHLKLLRGAAAETGEFLARMHPLGERLGPFMLQLPPAFGPDSMGILDRFLASLPESFRYSVELRHRSFYANCDVAEQANALLEARGCERVIMDTRALRSGDDQHPGVLAARHRKPDLPVSELALGPNPLIRFIGHPEASVNQRWIESWCRVVAGWMAEGRKPYVFVHCPDNTFAPSFGRRFHETLAVSCDPGEMPAWPGEKGQLSLL